jgi:hypothetical protein
LRPWCPNKPFNPSRKQHLATPNYGYEKRQKELAKKRKKEDKLKAKAERRTDSSGDAPGMADGDPLSHPLSSEPEAGDCPAS